jgi:hypothetical protein
MNAMIGSASKTCAYEGAAPFGRGITAKTLRAGLAAGRQPKRVVFHVKAPFGRKYVEHPMTGGAIRRRPVQ